MASMENDTAQNKLADDMNAKWDSDNAHDSLLKTGKDLAAGTRFKQLYEPNNEQREDLLPMETLKKELNEKAKIQNNK